MRKTPYTPEEKARRNELQRLRRASSPERTKEYERRWRERHPDKIKENNAKGRERLGPEYWREWGQKAKREMIVAYGGVCACCGESEITFLSIDHVNGGGAEDRKKYGGGGFIRHLRKEGWPQEGYRLLCMNCQFGFRFGRICPHQIPA